MILNNELNKIIDLIREIDSDFNYQYAFFIKIIPSEIRKEFKKCISFRKNLNNTVYQLINDLNKNNYIEVSVVNEIIEYMLTIDTSHLSFKNILGLKQKDLKEIKSSEINEFAALTFVNNDDIRTDYSFELHRLHSNKYLLMMKKNIFEYKSNGKTEIKSERTKTKEITFNELINKLKMNTPKR